MLPDIRLPEKLAKSPFEKRHQKLLKTSSFVAIFKPHQKGIINFYEKSFLKIELMLLLLSIYFNRLANRWFFILSSTDSIGIGYIFHSFFLTFVVNSPHWR